MQERRKHQHTSSKPSAFPFSLYGKAPLSPARTERDAQGNPVTPSRYLPMRTSTPLPEQFPTGIADRPCERLSARNPPPTHPVPPNPAARRTASKKDETEREGKTGSQLSALAAERDTRRGRTSRELIPPQGKEEREATSFPHREKEHHFPHSMPTHPQRDLNPHSSHGNRFLYTAVQASCPGFPILMNENVGTLATVSTTSTT
jgi:hypothetical protein